MSKVIHDMKFAVDAAKAQQAATPAVATREEKRLSLDEGAVMLSAGFEVKAGTVQVVGGCMTRQLKITMK